MKKRKFTILAALLIVVQAAWAQVTVTTAANLLEAVKTSQTVKLGADITTPSEGGRLDINNGITVTLDLNGHTLKRNMTESHPGGQAIIVNEGGKLTIKDSGTGGTITGGWANGGGGIYVREGGELTVEGGTISGNRAEKDADGNWGDGGGIDNWGTLTISGGTISGNEAENGGGINNEKTGTLTMTGGTISSNKAEDGGGICNEGTGQITGVTVSGNTASDDGGGIYAWATASGSMVLTDVTITNNQAQTGGGIALWKPESQNCTVELRGACIITSNTATLFGGGIYHFGYLDAREGPTLKMQDKPVVQSNTPTDVHIGNYQLITLSAPFTTGARVGVYCANEQQTVFTSGYKNHNGNTDPETFFFVSSPTADGDVVLSGDEAAIQATGYKYVERGWDAANNKLTETTKVCESYTVINSSTPNDNGWIGLEDGQWYVATGTAEVKVLNVLGTAHLILRDGAKLTVKSGVKVEQGKTLHIYGQPKGIGVPGMLIATNEEYEAAAIGSGDAADAGTIYFHGGTITATSRHGSGAAGIGGGYKHAGGNIYIYGGDITATSAYHAPGIGSGGDCPAASAGNVYIYGGNITAVAGVNAAGIGGGNDGAGPIVRIYGGDVTATGGKGGAGIGSGGKNGSNDSSWGDIAIYGGTVHANGGGAGIGGGDNCFRGTVNIQGGTVYADGYNTDFAIGSGSMDYGGQFSSSGNITISGGTVYAKSHGSSGNTSFGGSAIGGDGGTKVAITGGEIHAFFGNKTACIPIKIANSSLLTLGDNMTVYVGDNQRQDANGRVEALLSSHDGYALIRPCDHTNKTVSSFDDEYHYFSCSYCLTTPADNKEEHSFNDNDICEICGRNLTLTLYDNSSNSSTLQTYNGKSADAITLSGRTLYKGGMWNTLCLPFDVEIETSPLVGATAKYLNNATFAEGTLTLEFKDVVSYTSGGSTHTYLQAGTPYFIKWTTVGDPIQNPKFSYCFLASTEPTDITFDGVLTFRGNYNPLSISTKGDNTKLYLADDNTISYPKGATTIGAFQAYFQLADGITADESSVANVDGITYIKLKLGNGIATGITNTDFTDDTDKADVWYSIDGCRLTGKPTQKGIYINKGKRIIIK